MDEYKCPVCGTDHGLDTLCPECGFEPHILVDPLDGGISDYEKQRINQARAVWQRICDRMQALSASEPLAFLVTSRSVVYVVDMGLNSFGSAMEAKGDGNARHRRVALPGVSLRPVQFTIEAVKGERRPTFLLSETSQSGSEKSVFINSMQSPAGERAELSDGDTIIIRDNAGNKEQLIFRVNR